ncbi:hypothetical protein, partial [Scandinavium sp.]|uniref:hypothetical protein n=1 Tax=Scandinavium sp. TaxID=2830653 RepID=UPI00289F0B52
MDISVVGSGINAKNPDRMVGVLHLFDAWQLYSGQHCVLCKFVPDEFVPLRRALTGKQQTTKKPH